MPLLALTIAVSVALSCFRKVATNHYPRDPLYNELNQSNVGCFGLFECIDDRRVAAALFQAAVECLLSRGRSEIIGPIDYSTKYVCGLLIDGFEHPPAVLTAQSPYYRRLFEHCGFAKEAWSTIS